MKKVKYLLVMLFIIVATGFTAYAQDYEVTKEVMIDLEDYSEIANYGASVSDLIYHESDSSYYALLRTYPKVIVDSVKYNGIQPAIMKLNYNLEVEWIQQNFYGLDTIGALHTFNINDDGSITTTIRYQKYDVVSLNLSYNHLLKFELDKNGTILSRELLGNGVVSDTTVVYKTSTWSTTPSYEDGDPQKIDDVYYLKSNYNYNDHSGSLEYPNTYAYITRLTTEPFAIKRDFFYLNIDREDWSHLSLLSNGNYLFFTHTGHNTPRQRAGLYSSDFQILFDTTGINAYTSCIYDTANHVSARQLINDTINVVTLSEISDDGNRYLKIHQFDNEDGAYLGLNRKVKYQLRPVEPITHFDDAERLYGIKSQTKVLYDTVATDSIVKNVFYTYYFLYEKELGVLDTFEIKTFKSQAVGNRAVQIKSNEFVVAGNVVKYPEIRFGGYIYLAKIKTPEPVGVIDAEVEKKNMMYDVWVFNTYPNPAHSSTTVKFFCTPKHLENLKIVIYDEMGRAYPATDYEILNYDIMQGVGTMRVPLSGISSGPKYIMLQVNNDSFTTCIMVD